MLFRDNAREDGVDLILTDNVAVKLAIRLPFTKIAS
jgi:hypothetical protein